MPYGSGSAGNAPVTGGRSTPIECVTIGTAVPDGPRIASPNTPQFGYFARALPAFE
jgi:hypothetical protein